MLKKLIIGLIAASTISLLPAAHAKEDATSTTLSVEMEFWNSVKDSRSPDELQAYLKKYPNGQFAELAELRKRNLERLKTTPRSSESGQQNRPLQSTSVTVAPTGIDPRFNQYIDELKSITQTGKRTDIRTVFPVMLPVNERLQRQVARRAFQFFSTAYPNGGAISVGPTGIVILEVSWHYASQQAAEAQALTECERKRKSAEIPLPKCVIFFRSRALDSAALVNMFENARGPDFDAWMKGVSESVASWRR